MASGLIYIAIIGMWIAYFAPRWIHDRNEFSGKSVERFKVALTVVANSSQHKSQNGGLLNIDLDREAKIAQLLLRRRIIFVPGICISIKHPCVAHLYFLNFGRQLTVDCRPLIRTYKGATQQAMLYQLQLGSK